MVECGSIYEPPSCQRCTVWGIVIYIFMLGLAANSIYGVIYHIRFKGTFIVNLFNLIESGLGITGLILLVIALCRRSANQMKYGLIFLFFSGAVGIVIFIMTIIWYRTFIMIFRTLIQIIICFFFCFIFYQQSKRTQ